MKVSELRKLIREEVRKVAEAKKGPEMLIDVMHGPVPPEVKDYLTKAKAKFKDSLLAVSYYDGTFPHYDQQTIKIVTYIDNAITKQPGFHKNALSAWALKQMTEYKRNNADYEIGIKMDYGYDPDMKELKQLLRFNRSESRVVYVKK